MSIFNSQKDYGLLAKLFHWITFIILIAQIPFGFYLVGLEFSDRRIDLENIHILIGITVFYITLDQSKKVFFCTCKQTNDQPMCDGSHNA